MASASTSCSHGDFGMLNTWMQKQNDSVHLTIPPGTTVHPTTQHYLSHHRNCCCSWSPKRGNVEMRRTNVPMRSAAARNKPGHYHADSSPSLADAFSEFELLKLVVLPRVTQFCLLCYAATAPLPIGATPYSSTRPER